MLRCGTTRRISLPTCTSVTLRMGAAPYLDGADLAEALALDLALVTREVLERLQAWLALSDAQRRARPRLDVFKKRRWREE